jgi:MarR family 2-MHQ and catechol resistance regulon transcriptional repressor
VGTRHAGSAAEVRALNVFIKLLRATNTLRARLVPRLAAHDLTETQFGVLEALYHLGPLCQRDIGGKLLTSGGNVTLVVDNLERRGLVERVRGTEDRRFVTVHLTAAGRRLIAKAFPAHARRVSEALSALSVAEQEELGRLCRKLGTAVASASGPRPPR